MIIEHKPEYWDYQPSMKTLFENFPIKNILEFGLGEGTDFLLENERLVTSVELLADQQFAGWFDTIKEKQQSNPNWLGVYYECEDDWTKENEEFVTAMITNKETDFVFVDPCCHFRPMIVKTCIKNNIRFIAAHDTNLIYNVYTWDMANPDKLYYEVVVGRTTYYFRDEEDYNIFKGAM